MSVREVTTKTYVCDRCHVESANPFKSRGRVRITHNLHDFQGGAVAGIDDSYDLCEVCLGIVKEAMVKKQ